jgi:hypothetical protein
MTPENVRAFTWKWRMVRRPRNTALTMEELRFAAYNHTAGLSRPREAGTGSAPNN